MGSDHAIIPQQRPVPASNDERFVESQGSFEEAERLVVTLIEPPAEFPCRGAALAGLHQVIEALAEDLEGAAEVAQRIAPLCGLHSQLDLTAVRAQAIAAFTRRRKHHALYLAVVHAGLSISSTPAAAAELTQPVYRTLGAWCLRRAIEGWQPSRHSMARVVCALSRPTSRTSCAWSIEQRQRAAADAVHQLRVAVSKNPVAAVGLGLAQVKAMSDCEDDPIDAFNKKFRRRMGDLLEYKTADIQAGAGGHGALSAAGLKRAGRELMTGIRAGRPEDIHVALEVVSQLTSELIQLVPVQLDELAPERALAWINIPGGTYNYSLFKLLENGARPDPGTESLYEPTTQVVKVYLSPPLAAALRQAAHQVGKQCLTVHDLLGHVQHAPRDAVAGAGPYRVTGRKLQVSVPAQLLQRGQPRWVVSLATSSPALVSLGRPAYGVARQTDVDEVVGAAQDLLGWPRPRRERNDGTLIGSFVTPRLPAIRLVFSALVAAANAADQDPCTVDDVLERVNAHAAFLAALVAFLLCLRERVVYKLPTPGLLACGPLKFNDKDVHDYSMPAVPMLGIVSTALQGWTPLVRNSIMALERIGTAQAVELAQRLSSRLEDLDSVGWLFTISAAHTLEPIGTQSWRNRLPKALQLVGNFGRQFWPSRLLSAGLRQSDVDVLMRHQMPALHPGSSHVCVPEIDIHQRLVASMTPIVERDLQLALPEALGPRPGERE